jgi:hypothetical protein
MVPGDKLPQLDYEARPARRGRRIGWTRVTASTIFIVLVALFIYRLMATP